MVAALLGDALRLSPGDFFLSSQEGQGVVDAIGVKALADLLHSQATRS